MDTQKNNGGNHPEGCRCWMHGGNYRGHWGMGGMVVRIVIALIIAFVIFEIGVKVGEIKATLYGTGEWYYGHDFYGGYPMPMMRYYNYGAPGTAAPSAGATK